MGKRAMKTRVLFLVIAIWCIPVLSCRTTGSLQPSQRSRTNPTGPYIHSASGMTFPENIGAFQRVEVIQYDSTGNDISAGYNLINPTHRVFLTVYVYPIPNMTSVSVLPPLVTRKPLSDIDSNHFNGIKMQIEKSYPGARLVKEESVFLTQGGRRHEGKKATYECEVMPAFMHQQSLSDAYLFSYENWFIKYRISYLKASHQAVEYDIDHFMTSLQWP